MPEITALVKVEKLTPADLFKPEVIKPILELIREEATAQAALLDISTPGNRSDLASLAYKVGQSKTFIDKQRLELVGAEKKRLKVIDQSGGESWDYLEALQKEIRKPLTDWENAEKQRVADHEAAVAAIAENPAWGTTETSEEISRRIEWLESGAGNRQWQEFDTKAKGVIAVELARAKDLHAKAIKREEEQAELAKLRAEAAAREQKDREDRIAAAATEKAHQEAAEAREKAQREENARLNQAKAEKEAAEARAAKAEQDAKDAAAKAERDAVEASERAERERKAAVEAETKRIADAAAAEKAAADVKAQDLEHRREVNSNALADLVAEGVAHEVARHVLSVIAKGKIRNVKVSY